MRGRSGVGAAIGLAVSFVLLALLFAPRVLSGDYYEISTPLVFFGVPVLVIGASIGALVGVPLRAGATAAETSSPLPAGRTRSLVIAWVALVLAVWTMLWAMGFITVSPLGLG